MKVSTKPDSRNSSWEVPNNAEQIITVSNENEIPAKPLKECIDAMVITLCLVSVMAGSLRMAMMLLGLFLLAGAVLLAKVQPVSRQE